MEQTWIWHAARHVGGPVCPYAWRLGGGVWKGVGFPAEMYCTLHERMDSFYTRVYCITSMYAEWRSLFYAHTQNFLFICKARCVGVGARIPAVQQRIFLCVLYAICICVASSLASPTCCSNRPTNQHYAGHVAHWKLFVMLARCGGAML